MDLPSVLPDSIRIFVQKEGIRIEGVRCIQYDGCTRILLRRRPSGKFFVLLPVGMMRCFNSSVIILLLKSVMQKRHMEMESYP